MELKNNTITCDPRLDRVVQFDERSRQFPVRRLVGAVPAPITRIWDCVTTLDQGSEGACVGFGISHELIAEPVPIKRLSNEFARSRIYWQAQQIDPWPGGAYPDAQPFYEGTSVLAGVQIAQTLGFFESYHWSFSLEELILGIGYQGPAVLGLNWYSKMMTPDGSGFIHKRGSLNGGHCILCRGVNIEKQYFILHNSWGPDWGRGGSCYISFRDMEALLKEDGEAVFFDGRLDPAVKPISKTDMLKQIITAAIAFIASLTAASKAKDETIKEQAQTIKDQADTIENLKQQVADDQVDDAALEEAARAAQEAKATAEAKLAELQDPELEAKAQELAGLLNSEPEVPSVDPATFETV